MEGESWLIDTLLPRPYNAASLLRIEHDLS